MFISKRTFDPVKRRNAILGTAICVIVISILDDPSLLTLFASRRGLTSIALFVIAGFFFARGIIEIAESVLRSPGQPWYARCGALGFLVIATVVITGIWIFVGKPLSNAIGTPLGDETGYLYLVTGITFLWIVLLQWVSYEK